MICVYIRQQEPNLIYYRSVFFAPMFASKRTQNGNAASILFFLRLHSAHNGIVRCFRSRRLNRSETPPSSRFPSLSCARYQRSAPLIAAGNSTSIRRYSNRHISALLEIQRIGEWCECRRKSNSIHHLIYVPGTMPVNVRKWWKYRNQLKINYSNGFPKHFEKKKFAHRISHVRPVYAGTSGTFVFFVIAAEIRGTLERTMLLADDA